VIPFITVARLRRDRIYVRLEGELLRFRAPAGALTPDRLAWLRAHKPAIVAYLASEGPDRPAGAAK
jgi:hypothetical protein